MKRKTLQRQYARDRQDYSDNLYAQPAMAQPSIARPSRKSMLDKLRQDIMSLGPDLITSLAKQITQCPELVQAVAQQIVLSPEQIKGIAEQVAQLGGGALPHRGALKAAGMPGLDQVKAIAGTPEAQVATALMGAEAFAYDGTAVFHDANPSLEAVGHEVTHLRRQAQGQVPAGGVGQPGDAFEQEADAIGAMVARGEDVSAMLGDVQGTSSSAVQAKAVQMKEASGGGGVDFDSLARTAFAQISPLALTDRLELASQTDTSAMLESGQGGVSVAAIPKAYRYQGVALVELPMVSSSLTVDASFDLGGAMGAQTTIPQGHTLIEAATLTLATPADVVLTSPKGAKVSFALVDQAWVASQENVGATGLDLRLGEVSQQRTSDDTAGDTEPMPTQDHAADSETVSENTPALDTQEDSRDQEVAAIEHFVEALRSHLGSIQPSVDYLFETDVEAALENPDDVALIFEPIVAALSAEQLQALAAGGALARFIDQVNARTSGKVITDAHVAALMGGFAPALSAQLASPQSFEGIVSLFDDTTDMLSLYPGVLTQAQALSETLIEGLSAQHWSALASSPEESQRLAELATRLGPLSDAHHASIVDHFGDELRAMGGLYAERAQSETIFESVASFKGDASRALLMHHAILSLPREQIQAMMLDETAITWMISLAPKTAKADWSGFARGVPIALLAAMDTLSDTHVDGFVANVRVLEANGADITPILTRAEQSLDTAIEAYRKQNDPRDPTAATSDDPKATLLSEQRHFEVRIAIARALLGREVVEAKLQGLDAVDGIEEVDIELLATTERAATMSAATESFRKAQLDILGVVRTFLSGTAVRTNKVVAQRQRLSERAVLEISMQIRGSFDTYLVTNKLQGSARQAFVDAVVRGLEDAVAEIPQVIDSFPALIAALEMPGVITAMCEQVGDVRLPKHTIEKVVNDAGDALLEDTKNRKISRIIDELNHNQSDAKYKEFREKEYVDAEGEMYQDEKRSVILARASDAADLLNRYTVGTKLRASLEITQNIFLSLDAIEQRAEDNINALKIESAILDAHNMIAIMESERRAAFNDAIDDATKALVGGVDTLIDKRSKNRAWTPESDFWANTVGKEYLAMATGLAGLSAAGLGVAGAGSIIGVWKYLEDQSVSLDISKLAQLKGLLNNLATEVKRQSTDRGAMLSEVYKSLLHKDELRWLSSTGRQILMDPSTPAKAFEEPKTDTITLDQLKDLIRQGPGRFAKTKTTYQALYLQRQIIDDIMREALALSMKYG